MNLLKKILLLVVIVIPITATVTTVSALDSSQQAFVESPKNILSTTEASNLNDKLQKYSESTIDGEKVNTQFAVKVVNSLNNQSIEDYGKSLFNKLGIGDSEHNLGILLVVSIQDHKYRVQLGNGWDGTELNESKIESYVFTDSVKNLLRSEDYSSAINEMVDSTMQLAGTTVTIPSELNIDSSNITNDMDSYEFAQSFKNSMSASFISLLKAFGVMFVVLFAPVMTFISLHNFNKTKRIKRTKALLSKDMTAITNISKEEKNLLDNPTFLKSMVTLKGHSIDQLAEDFVNHRSDLSPESLLKFVKSEAKDVEKQIKRENDLEKIGQLLTNDYEWALPVKKFGEVFLKSKLEINLENMKMFSDNLKHNKTILKKQKDADTYNIDKQALNLTTKNPTTRFNDDLLLNLITYQILSDSYRTSRWQDDHRPSYDSSSDYSSSFSDFGGGGFSDGGGASGGW